jgi:hypothetical protein
MKITMETMRDAKTFENEASHANHYHKAYKVTVAIAEDMLNQVSMQSMLAESYNATDLKTYHDAFIAFIAWDTVGKYAK